jgi:hypothetical protein
MGKQRTAPPYAVSIYDDPTVAGALRFTFVPASDHPARAEGESAPQYIVSVRRHQQRTEFNWIKRPPREEIRQELEEIARERVTKRGEWLDNLAKLTAWVQKWADELGWATRAVDKKMEDAEIGSYKAPALLLQQEAVRLFLEPVARAVPGAEGVVDLYLMPSYDDIASLYFYNGRWNVHYLFPEAQAVASVFEAEARPLTKATLQAVFEAMKVHAG